MIDSHSHIYGPRFESDQAAVIERAVAAGNRQLLQVGCNLDESREVVALAEKVPGIYASVGVHPHDAHTVDDNVLTGLRQLTEHPKVVAWGEIGLDYYYDNSPRDIQCKAFARQMTLAEELRLPVVIHTRDAEDDTLDIMRKCPISRGGQVHCFTGTSTMAEALLDLGYHIGFTGIITFKNASALRDVVRHVPLERMLIETDSPYLAPMPHRGKRNEPSFVKHVAEKVADIKATSVDEVIEKTTANFYALYAKTGTPWIPLQAV